MRRSTAGIILIEILIVVGVVVVAVAATAVVIPLAQERARQTESINNVKSLATLMSERSIRKGWPEYTGKNFVLSLVAQHIVDVRRPDNLTIFFSPGDYLYMLDRVDPGRYRDITTQTLKAGYDFHELTSYAGRRNHDRDYMLTAGLLRRVAPIICDDDDGALHHTDGLVMGYSDGSARFVTWEDLDMPPPENPNDPEPFLGDNATSEFLRGLSSR